MQLSGRPSRTRCPSARSCVRIASQPSSSRYSTAATKPASSSCASVPVSKRQPIGSSAAGRTLYGRQDRRQLVAAVGEAEMRAEELVRRAEEDVDAERAPRRSARAARSAPRRPTRARSLRARARRCAPRQSSSRPRSRPAERRRPACGRSASARGRRGRGSCPRGSRRSSTRRSRSWASSSHGATFPSWSRRVTRISSPRASVRPSVRVSAKLSVVMFWPNVVSPARSRGSARRSRAPARPASSLRRLGRERSRRGSRSTRAGRRRPRRSPTAGTASPGPSRKATPEESAGKRARIASRSKAHPCSSGAIVRPCSRSCSQ